MWPIAATATAKAMSIISRQGMSLGGASGLGGRAPIQPQTTAASMARPARIRAAVKLMRPARVQARGGADLSSSNSPQQEL